MKTKIILKLVLLLHLITFSHSHETPKRNFIQLNVFGLFGNLTKTIFEYLNIQTQLEVKNTLEENSEELRLLSEAYTRNKKETLQHQMLLATIEYLQEQFVPAKAPIECYRSVVDQIEVIL